MGFRFAAQKMNSEAAASNYGLMPVQIERLAVPQLSSRWPFVTKPERKAGSAPPVVPPHNEHIRVNINGRRRYSCTRSRAPVGRDSLTGGKLRFAFAVGAGKQMRRASSSAGAGDRC